MFCYILLFRRRKQCSGLDDKEPLTFCSSPTNEFAVCTFLTNDTGNDAGCVSQPTEMHRIVYIINSKVSNVL